MVVVVSEVVVVVAVDDNGRAWRGSKKFGRAWIALWMVVALVLMVLVLMVGGECGVWC